MPIELIEVLAKKFPESSRTTLRGMIADKRILVDGKPARTLKQLVEPTVSVELIGRIEARQRVVGSVPYRVIFEDRDLLIVDKPAGVLSSSGDNDKRATMAQVLADHFAQIDGKVAIGLIHRLDKDASGLLVFSKTPAAYESLKEQFADRSAKRVYRAIVSGTPRATAGKIESKLVELADGTVKSTTHRDYGEPAATHFSVLETRGKHTMLRVELETGRKHQIRVHMAEQGTPIAGDPFYNPHTNQAPRLMLIAAELTLKHPKTDAPMTWTIDLPKDVQAWWDEQPKSKSKPK